MKKILNLVFASALFAFIPPGKADFGDADFPVQLFMQGPKSYHDGWCRNLENECRVRFQGKAMWVEGQGGIERSQYVRYRYAKEEGKWRTFRTEEHYNYISYVSKNGEPKEALFLFANDEAQRNFMKAFMKWKRQDSLPIPNYRFPNSQGPQDTQGRDKGLNPYDNPPIIDWSEKTTIKESPAGINCDSQVWRNKPLCIDV